ncbi:MAG: DUF4013 domain-containing protein [Chloroflexota bacterium]
MTDDLDFNFEPAPAEQSGVAGTEKPSGGIDFGRAFAFMVEDSRWYIKMTGIALLTLVTSVFFLVPLWLVILAIAPPDLLAELSELLAFIPAENIPFTSTYWLLILPVMGAFLGLMLLLGYYIEFVRQVRGGAAHPLPAWDEFGRKLYDGAMMTFAYMGYLASNLAIAAVFVVLIRQVRGLNAELIQTTLAFCGLLPFMLIYGLVIIFLTSINVLPYSDSGNILSFYRVGWVWRRLRQDTRLTLQWFGYGLLANIGFSAPQVIPGIGNIASIILQLFMSIPVQGHLLGQYAITLDEKYGNVAQA